MVWLTDADGMTIYVNQRWSSVTGQTYEQALGHGWLSVVHADDKETAVTAANCARNGHLPCHTQYRVRDVDGEYQMVVATSYPLFDHLEQYIGYVGSNAVPEHAASVAKEAQERGKAFILSKRERAVLTWVAAGLTAEEIASKMAIAPRTVEFHIHSSARKLKSSNRVQTVAKAAVFGEIDLSAAIGL